MSACVFCSIVAAESPACRLYEDDQSLAFLDAAPATRGHTLVVPQTHYETVTDMPEALAGAVFQTVHRIASALETVYSLDGVTIVQSNGAAAGQDVDHAHVHVIPRYDDDTVTLAWRGDPPAETAQQAIAAAVRAELASLA